VIFAWYHNLSGDTLHQHSIFDLNPAPRPNSNIEIKKLVRAGEFERYVEYGARDDTDSVLFVLDCEDVCPVDVCSEFTARILRMRIGKNMAYPPSTAALRHFTAAAAWRRVASGDPLRPLCSAQAVAVHQDGIGGRGRPVERCRFLPGPRKISAQCVAGTDCGLGGRVHAALMQGVVLSKN
jgi:hypothetical protein